MMEEFKGIVSLFIASIELLLLINLLIFAEKNPVNRKAILLLFFLFIYQLFEFLICYAGLTFSFMVYLSFVAITFLPPLGLHIVLEYFFTKHKLYYLLYLPAILILTYYLTMLHQFEVMKCTVIYVVFNYPLGFLYGVLYYSPVLMVMIFLFIEYREGKNIEKKAQSKLLLYGYISTFIPMSAAVFFYPDATLFIESVLCKLALILAVCYSIFALRNGKSKNISFKFLKKP